MKVELRAQALVHGGETLAHHQGRVVFLLGAAPGDLVEAEIGGGGRFEHARSLRVLEKGAARVEPPCPIVERCGGCPIQQVRYQDQLAAKEALAADALLRIGGFAAGSYELAPIVPSPKQFGYRRRARLHRAAGGAWGFAWQGRTQIEPVEACLLFEPGLQELADAFRSVELPGIADLGLLAGANGKGAVDLRGEITPATRRRAGELLSRRVKGVTLGAEILGDPIVAEELRPGLRLRARPDTFAQANRSMVPVLQRAALDAVGDAAEVLELFCGSGTLTLPLLDAGKRVTAVESVGPSLQLLRKSADEAGLAVKLIAGDAAKIAATFEGRPDCVLLDPPRTGAAGTVQALAGLAPRRIVYVSCDAPTLARDGKALAGAGYRLVKATPLDLFPQTGHFEVVAAFVRE